MLDILFPRTCPCCDNLLHKNEMLCRTCYGSVKYVSEWSSCRKCGFPFGFFSEEDSDDTIYETEQDGGLCGRCVGEFYCFEKARSIAIYEGIIRDLLISFKYEGKLNREYALLALMTSNFPDDLDEFDCMVPVPLHLEKLRKREYNQSVVLASSLAKHMGLECDVFELKRIRDTRPQIELSGEDERRRNVRGAFSVTTQNGIKGRSVLLVDVVFTTGSTCDECSKMLLKSGAYSHKSKSNLIVFDFKQPLL